MRFLWLWLIDIICYTLYAHAAGVTKTDVPVKRQYRRRGGKELPNSSKPTEDACKAVSYDNVAPLLGPVARFFLETIMTMESPGHPIFRPLTNFTFLFPYMKHNKVNLLVYHICTLLHMYFITYHIHYYIYALFHIIYIVTYHVDYYISCTLLRIMYIITFSTFFYCIIFVLLTGSRDVQLLPQRLCVE